MILIGLSGLIIPQSFADDLFYGEATFERVPESIIPGIPSEFEIKFLYTGAPYTLQNLTAIIETNPKTASQYVHYVLDSTEMTPSTVGRIPVTITIDKSIPNEKIFLSVTYAGTDLHGNSFRSAWANTLTLDVTSKNFTSSKLPSSQDYPFEKLTGARCDGESAICYGTFYNGTSIPIQCDYRHSCGVIRFDNDVFYQSPLKQFKSGILYGDIQCKSGLGLVVKTTNRHFACVKPESISKLFERGWTSNVNLGGESSRHCYQEPEHGICNASREKYYFDWETRSCKSFTWGGCGGSVPFDTLQSCKSLCN